METEAVARAREAYARRAWRDAYSAYASECSPADLELDDFENQAVAAHLLGKDSEALDILARGYREALRVDDVRRAVKFAFWLSQSLIFDGRESEASGWQTRARQLLEARQLDCPECGYVFVLGAIQRLLAGDASAAQAAFSEARATGVRFGDLTLLAVSSHGRGRALIRMGRVDEGMADLDSAMVSVTSGEVSPMIAGDIYCGVLEACNEVFDLRRAREWLGALSRWCEDDPELVAYRGPCMLHRAQVMQLQGAWADAFEEAQRACQWLSSPVSPEGPADAFYRIGELHRLRGNAEAAEEAYRQATRSGRRPEPGLPLLWLRRGQAEAARKALGRALIETAGDPGTRATLLDADIQVSIELHDAGAARSAASELTDIAMRLGGSYLRAMAERGAGAALLLEGDPAGSLAPLRRSWMAWQRLEVPYESATVRVLIGRAYRELGDLESAEMEIDAARWVFEQLGAAAELARLDATMPRQGGAALPGGLSPRELEVLRLVAGGATNKQIAAALVISEHTVASHVQHLLTKLDCTSRTALAVFAVEHGLATDSQF